MAKSKTVRFDIDGFKSVVGNQSYILEIGGRRMIAYTVPAEYFDKLVCLYCDGSLLFVHSSFQK